jgi:anaerobic magnesium-protoporphyrin IX monomethyl ester cyclase
MMRVRPHSNMLTSRGCPYNCTFCASTRFWPNIRYFSPEAMIEEIKHLRDTYGVRYITFHDDLFIANTKRLAGLHELVLREGLPRQGFRFSCASSATRITDDTARMLKEMNFVSISMGLESGNQEVLTRLKGKAFKVDINENAVHTLHRHGIHPHASFIIGEPQETVEQMMETHDFIRRNPLSLVNLYVLTPLPGTPVWHAAKSRGLVSDDMDWDLLNISFELDWQRVILVSETVSRSELHRVYQKLRRLRLVKYAKALATHPFQMDLPEYGRAKLVEWAYRFKSAVTNGPASINAGLDKAH